MNLNSFMYNHLLNQVISQSFLLTVVTVMLSLANAFGDNQGWTDQFEHPDAFIENKGQFQLRQPCNGDSEVLYAYDHGPVRIYFTKSGVSFSLTKPKSEEEEGNYEERFESTEEWLEYEKKEKKGSYKTDDVSYHWKGANENVEVKALNKADGYYSYSYNEDGELNHRNHIDGYEKIIYKNLYPNIDVVFELHPENGIKYSLILHPGSDVSDFAMVYSGDIEKSDDGNIKIPTELGNIIDHAPASFYKGNEEAKIPSDFDVTGKTVSFQLADYDTSRRVVIDPWTETPNVTNPTGVWEVEVDSAGNVYVIGGGTPMRLIKYDASGTFQWSYNTPYDTNNGDWLGALATDNAGNSYVTRGSIADLTKVDASANVIYSVAGGSQDEYWQIAFNCDQSKLVIGGTRLPTNLTDTFKSAMIFDVDPSNGNVNKSVFVGYSRSGTPSIPREVRAITSSYNGKYYYLTHDSIGGYDQNLGGACPEPDVEIDHGYQFAYKCEDFRPDNGNGPFAVMEANANFVYAQNGSIIKKHDVSSLGVLDTATIPGGITTTNINGFNKAGNSGTALDACGNVYVGSSDRIVKFDPNLNIITSTSVAYRVLDVEVSPSGEVVICGTTGTTGSPSRTGYVQSVDLNACAPNTLACCDANVNLCPRGPFCTSDSSITLDPNTPGGTWSGPGVDSATGEFDPSAAGPGTHKIGYTLPCGSDSILLEVDSNAISINRDTSICEGDSIMIGGYYQTDGGMYTDTLSTSAGCDTLLTTDLSIDSVYQMTDSIGICGGDSVLAGGDYQTSPGIYYDSLTTVEGCDSIQATVVEVDSNAVTMNRDTSICDGDSIFLAGAYRSKPGTYADTIAGPNTCDTIRATTLGIYSLPVVSLNGLDSVYCETDPSDTLTGSPSGGNFAGPGVTDEVFHPGDAGGGTHTITYTHIDTNNCTNTVSQNVKVDVCNSIDDRSDTPYEVRIKPNPFTKQTQFTVKGKGAMAIHRAELFNYTGELVRSKNVTDEQFTIHRKHLSAGIYFYRISLDDGSALTGKVMVK